MDTEQQKALSKRLSYVLRHRPDSIGIALEENGWVQIRALLSALAKSGASMTPAALEEIVANNDKKRFEVDVAGERIRARQGHSVEVDLGYEAAEPPDVLYHGTAERNIASIRANGIHKAKRHHVHMSVDRELMTAVGARHGKPVVVTVDAAAMQRAGHEFYVTENKVWLIEEVPAEYLIWDA